MLTLAPLALAAVVFVEAPADAARFRISDDATTTSVNLARLGDASRESVVKRAERYLELGKPVKADDHRCPLMGWSSYKSFGLAISQELILEQARVMASNGLKQAGYVYVNVDDGFSRGHDEAGNLMWETKGFPNGLKETVDGIHALGLKAGIYSRTGFDSSVLWDGSQTSFADGLYGHEKEDCRLFFTDLGFDFLKLNGFFIARLRSVDHRAAFAHIADVVRQTGRDVRINICTQAFPGTWAAQYGESWRTGDDVTPNWWTVQKAIDECLYLSAYASPGHYNDMDVLTVGRLRTKELFDEKWGFSQLEEQTYFGMLCMLSSPLVLGRDLRTFPSSTLNLVTNPYLLHMNQNEGIGVQGRIVNREGNAIVFVKDADERFGRSRYVALYNGTESEREFRLDPSWLDLNGQIEMFDLVERADAGTLSEGWSIKIPPHGSKFYRLDAEERLEQTLYEAEAGFLSDYQTIRNGWEAGTAYVCEGPYAAQASGGMVVKYLGRRETNDLIWKDVMIKKGGLRKIEITGCAFRPHDIFVQVDGGPKTRLHFVQDREQYQTVSFEIELSEGLHEVRIFNPHDWCPDIDKMEIR